MATEKESKKKDGDFFQYGPKTKETNITSKTVLCSMVEKTFAKQVHDRFELKGEAMWKG